MPRLHSVRNALLTPRAILQNYNANPLRGLYSLSVEATEVYENAREAVRKFIGAEKSNEIIFTRNTTESLNLVAYSYGLSNVKRATR